MDIDEAVQNSKKEVNLIFLFINLRFGGLFPPSCNQLKWDLAIIIIKTITTLNQAIILLSEFQNPFLFLDVFYN